MALSTPVMSFLYAKQKAADIRDELVEFNSLKKLNFPEKIRAVSNAHHAMITAEFPRYQRTDGIVGYSYLRYAVGEDKRPGKTQGTMPIYFATESEALATETNEHGHNQFVSDHGRYLATTLPANSSPKAIKNAIEQHVMDFSDFGSNCMTVSGGDLTEMNQNTDSLGRRRPQKVYGYTNDQLCITVRQNPKTDGGGWTLKLSKPFRNDDAQAYTAYDNIDPKMWWLKTLLSNGAVYDTYSTKEEALANVDMLLNASLQLVWQHKEPLKIKASPSKTVLRFLTFATSAAHNFLNKEWNFENVKEAVFDAGWTLGIAVAGRMLVKGAVAGVATISLPATIAGVIGFNYAVRKFKSGVFNVMDRIKLWAGGTKAFFGIGGEYVDPSLENMRRNINPKPNTNVEENVHVLNGQELDLTYSDAEQVSPVEQEKTRRKRIAQPISAVSKKTNHIDRYTSTTPIFNGLSCLNHWDPIKKIHTSYYKLTGATNLNEHIQLTDKEKDALLSGRIVKHVHQKGKKSISEDNVPFSRMERDLKSRMLKVHDKNLDIPATEKRTEQAFAHVRWLFNNKAVANDNALDQDGVHDDLGTENTTIEESATAKTKRHLGALKIAFGDKAVEIPEASRELINFYKGCVLPDVSWIAATP